MSEEPKCGLGRAIMHGIIHEGLVKAVEPGMSVWNANTDEMLEAIVADFYANAIPCSQCGNYAVRGEGKGKEFVCTDCLPPIED